MKYSLVICISAIVFVANAQGATYVTNFNSFDDQLDVAGQDGWIADDPTWGNSFIVIAGTKAAALGGYYGDPVTATVGLTHSYGEDLRFTSMSFNFVIVDSTNDDSVRDTFGVTLRDGPNNLFTVFFSPQVQSLTPDLGPDARWNLSYKAGSGATVSAPEYVLEGGYYSLDLQFTPNGPTTDFNLALSGSNTVVWNGNMAVDPATVATDFGLTWKPTDGAANAGSNYFVVDNLSVVPEPSAALLALLGASAGLVRRRRRAC